MFCLQVDILHPLTTLEWEQCGQVPKKVGSDSMKCFTLGKEIFMASGSRLSVSTDLHSWTCLGKLPVTYGILTTYHSQLVLVGGIEDISTIVNFSVSKASNKLWSLSILILMSGRSHCLQCATLVINASGQQL